MSNASNSIIASKYAEALFSACIDMEKKGTKNYCSKVIAQFKQVIDIFNGDNKEVYNKLISPLINYEDKLDIIKKVYEKKLESILFETIILLVKRGRLSYINDVYEGLNNIYDEYSGVVRGTIRIASEPDDKRKNKIIDSLSRATGKKVVASFEEDPFLMAGFVTFLGTHYIDYSLSSHLDKLENELKRS